MEKSEKWSSDLNDVKVGDWIATIAWGWVKVIHVFSNEPYPIHVECNSSYAYTFDGKDALRDKAPSAFTVPPKWLVEIIGLKPCEFKKGDKVMVWDTDEEDWIRRYFSHQKGNKFYCYTHGATPWSNDTGTVAWERYRKPTEEELKWIK